MKKLIFSLCAAVATLPALAQMKEGKIIFERTTQMRFQFRGGPDGEVTNAAPQTMVNAFELLFGGGKSLWQSLPDVNQEANQITPMESPTVSGGRAFTIRRFGGDDAVYVNYDEGKRLTSREINSKQLVVEDSISKLNWKMTDETKSILGKKAFKATAQTVTSRTTTSMENGEMKRREVPDTLNIVAWFTPEIPVPAGPAYQGQLPGMILEIDINKGQTVYKAVEISSKVNLSNIKEPKGKRITSAEYDKEREAMMEEMRRRMQENGGRLIISQN